MEKKNIDWSNIGFGYIKTDKRYVSNFKNGAWDEGTLTDDANIVLSECAGVLQYAQTVFEGLKAYTTEDGRIVCFRPDLNASRMADSAKRLEMPAFPEDRFVKAVEETDGGYVYYKTDDKKIIEEVINALKNIKVKDKVNIAFSDNGKTYMIVLKDGETLTYNFQGGYYNKNNQNYETSNYESLRKIDIPKE